MIEPYYGAALVWAISGGNVTRDTERWILWELPLARALQYYHCACRAALKNTVKPVATDGAAARQSSAAHSRALEVDKAMAEEVLV